MLIAQMNGTEPFYTQVGTGLPCLAMHGGLGSVPLHRTLFFEANSTCAEWASGELPYLV